MKNLKEIINKNDNLLETYILLGELLDPNNAYEYKKEGTGIYSYYDVNDNQFFVRLLYQPTKNPHYEIKTWWVDENGKLIYKYLPDNVTAMDWDKRSNTIAKIYRDELLPFFKKQNATNILKIKPIDSKRYQFSIRLAKKFMDNTLKIEEDYPKEIRIIKK